jgi:hypothetical protein
METMGDRWPTLMVIACTPGLAIGGPAEAESGLRHHRSSA